MAAADASPLARSAPIAATESLTPVNSPTTVTPSPATAARNFALSRRAPSLDLERAAHRRRTQGRAKKRMRVIVRAASALHHRLETQRRHPPLIQLHKRLQQFQLDCRPRLVTATHCPPYSDKL